MYKKHLLLIATILVLQQSTYGSASDKLTESAATTVTTTTLSQDIAKTLIQSTELRRATIVGVVTAATVLNPTKTAGDVFLNGATVATILTVGDMIEESTNIKTRKTGEVIALTTGIKFAGCCIQ